MVHLRTALVLALVLAALPAAAAFAQAPPPGPYEGAERSYRNILPPGQNGHADAAGVARFLTSGDRPPHNSDQLGLYEDLVHAVPGLRRSDLGTFFKDASFGVAPGDVSEQYRPCGPTADLCKPAIADHPCAEVTVQRDAGFGVPHIYGGTRAGAMCAAGYVAAEDRLFLIDVLRHAGRAQLSSFAGGSEGNREMDRTQWAIAPYTEQDLQDQIDQFDEIYGREGRRLQGDLDAYVAGVNQYIFEARLDPTMLPGAYAAVIGPGEAIEGAPVGPDDFRGTDVVAIASLVGGIFGKGGGAELDSALLLQSLEDRFGAGEGERVWEDLRSAEEPEAPTTVLGRSFPYLERPANPAPASLALPDPGSYEPTDVVASSSGVEGLPGGILGGLLDSSGASSNALLVSARESASGHPIAVFGPQTGYFSPQLLMEMDIHGPGIDARGAAFAGTNLYVQLGRGLDYAWSATSAGQDIVDTFALELCEPGGAAASLSSSHYRYRGRCLPFETLERVNSWTPNAADQTPPGTETLRANRTKLGLEVGRARLGGDPIVYVALRSTYLHEVDSARGFADFNNPRRVDDAGSYQRAAAKIGYTFNWLYTDDDQIAYFNSGENPERASGADPSFPVRACPTAACEFEWRGYEPIRTLAERERGDDRLTGNRVETTPFAEHPQVVDQRYLTSWNNKQAPGFRANDANFDYQSLYRSVPLDERIRAATRGPRTMSLVELVEAMESAGTVDLRGDQVLPWMLRVLEPASPRGGAGGSAAPADRASEPGARGRAGLGGPEPADELAKGIAAQVAGSEQPCPAGLDAERAAALLARWHADGAHRRDLDDDGRYEHSCAIEVMDAWWPLLAEAQFRPTIGRAAYDRRLALGGIDNEPNNGGGHIGSAYQGGFYGYVEKDLRTLLGAPVEGEYSRSYCGGRERADGSVTEGSLARCRRVLERTLSAALEVPREGLYSSDATCSSAPELEDQYCFDTVAHTAAGAITQPLIHWINRPTFQQVVEIRTSRGLDQGPDRSGGGRDGGRGGRDGSRSENPTGGRPERSSEDGGAGSQLASADPGADGGAATSGTDSGGLPFTGLALVIVALTGLALAAGGLAARRR